MKKLLICVVMLLGGAVLLHAMQPEQNTVTVLPKLEELLVTPFAQLLKEHGWVVGLVDYNATLQQTGMACDNSLFKMIRYESPNYAFSTGKKQYGIRFAISVRPTGVTYLAQQAHAWMSVSDAPTDSMRTQQEIEVLITKLMKHIAEGTIVLNIAEQAVWKEISFDVMQEQPSLLPAMQAPQDNRFADLQPNHLLQTPFATLLKEHGWKIDLVDVPDLSGTCLDMIPGGIKMVRY